MRTMKLSLLLGFSLVAFLSGLSLAQEQAYCACATYTFGFMLTNPESIADSFAIGVDSFADSIILSENPVILEPGAAKAVNYRFTIPCNASGTPTITFVFDGEQSGRTFSQQFPFPVYQCLGVLVEFGEPLSLLDEDEEALFVQADSEYVVCQGASLGIPFIVGNAAAVQQSYTAKLSGPSWAALEGNSFPLEPEQKGLGYIILNVPENGTGMHGLNLTLSSGSDLATGIPPVAEGLSVLVEECYSAELFVEEPTSAVCGCEEQGFAIRLLNTGTHDLSPRLMLDAPEWVTLSFDSASVSAGPLEANAALTGQVMINPPCDASGTALGVLMVENALSGAILARQELSYSYHPPSACYKSTISERGSYSVQYGDDSFSLELSNRGVVREEYAITLEGQPWLSLEQAEPVTLSRGDQHSIVIRSHAEPSVPSGVYNATLFVESDTFSETRELFIRLREQPALLKFALQAWYGYWPLLSSGVAGLVLAVLLVFALARTKGRGIRKKRQRKNLKIIMWALAFLILAAVAYSFRVAMSGFLFWYRYYLYTLIVLAIAGFLLFMAYLYHKRFRLIRKEAGAAGERLRKVMLGMYVSAFALALGFAVAVVLVRTGAWWTILAYASFYWEWYTAQGVLVAAFLSGAAWKPIVGVLLALLVSALLYGLLRRRAKQQKGRRNAPDVIRVIGMVIGAAIAFGLLGYGAYAFGLHTLIIGFVMEYLVYFGIGIVLLLVIVGVMGLRKGNKR
ncbi:TPA: hypothetical protein HA270_03735 [Candidatus Woesearchaeota archaeon]|nr:hypothetical protein [Candidatus Woesearchaeota archaeon]